MQIKLINPNTTTSMTELMGETARMVAAPSSEVILATSRSGAASIEGHYDEALSVVGVIDEITNGKPADAYIIGCFGDPGLLAAREITASPVLGIAEAAMHAATFVATSFSIVTTLERTRIISEHLVRNYGMQHHCRRVRATDVPVLELEEPGSKADATILAECEKALVEDRAEAIVLGCAGMSNLVERLQQRLGVPVIDGVAAAVKFAEALVGMGLRTSKIGDLAYPLPKAYAGKLAEYAPAHLKLRETSFPALATAVRS
ncbi:aspartate/glutamate racemase family protein [Ensifer adhaerens]|uniref:aspartate/glutamate racemase family protein n=1 Tax=Ensifer adhaerens TaxID=106592 RepID=UPI001C4E236B|nr:aspartate/glutamate racemase family protein [Ensifer adhaerens]MBW0368373.1 aspartate/glutamate racemase family protein [Ensifer adhaerens]UCM25013.1 aspartate/glutamate racemase family protein [Ensifer adhaerens]